MPLGPALRNAVRGINRRRGATLLALASVVVSAALFALVMAATVGQQAYLRERIAAVTPHVMVTAERLEPLVPRRLVELEDGVVELVVNTPPTDRHEIKPRVEVATRARRSSDLVSGVAPFVLLKGVLRNGPRYHAVEIRGIDPTHERGVGVRRSDRQGGAFAMLKGKPDATIVGVGLAQRLGIAAGRDVTLITSSGVIRRLGVIGVVRSDVDAVDDERVYVNIELAQSLRGMARNAATGLALTLSDPQQAERAAISVERATGYRTATWEQTGRETLGGYGARQIAAWVVAGLAMLVAAFGLANALTSTVLASRERAPRAEPAAVAMRPSDVVVEGAIVGLAGGAIGGAIGLGIAYWIARSGIEGLSLVDDFVRFDRYPMLLDASVVLTTVALSALVALAAAIAPARRAARPIASPGAPLPVEGERQSP
jgi:lipoprotein-releasing system permease protein